MDQETVGKEERGTFISLSVPAPEPDIFGNKATNDILLFLSRHRFREFTVRELADRTDNAIQTTRRSVDVLEKNGLVVDSPEGNRRLVRINRERLSVPDDPYLRIPQEEFQEPVKAAVGRIEDRLDGVKAVVLYGSVARGEADRRSDIDLWVLVGKDRAESQREANRIKQDLVERRFDGDRYGYDIDVESVSSIPRYTEEIREILESGIPVYETEEFEKVEKLLLNEGGADE
jgi:predicted nucleotidyltransferase